MSAQPSPMCPRSVCPIGVQLTWTFPRTAAKSFDRWDSFDKWNKEARVVYLGARDLSYQRQSALIYEQVVFAAELATISRISARVRHPQGRVRWQRQRKLDPT